MRSRADGPRALARGDLASPATAGTGWSPEPPGAAPEVGACRSLRIWFTVPAGRYSDKEDDEMMSEFEDAATLAAQIASGEVPARAALDGVLGRIDSDPPGGEPPLNAVVVTRARTRPAGRPTRSTTPAREASGSARWPACR